MEPFSSACRLCLWKGDKMIDVFRCNQKCDILDKIHKCIPIQFQKTDVTHVICHNCYYKLEIFAEFLTVCSRSDAILKRYVESQSVSPSKESLEYPDLRVVTINDSSDDAITEDEEAFATRRRLEKSKASASTVVKHDISHLAETNEVSAAFKHAASPGQLSEKSGLTNEQSKQQQKPVKPKSPLPTVDQSSSKVQEAVPATEPAKQAPKPQQQKVKTVTQDKLPVAQSAATVPEKQAAPPKKAAAPQDKQSPAQIKQPTTPEKHDPPVQTTPKKAAAAPDKQAPAQNKPPATPEKQVAEKQVSAQKKQSVPVDKPPAQNKPSGSPDKPAAAQSKPGGQPDKPSTAQNNKPNGPSDKTAPTQDKPASPPKKPAAAAEKQVPAQVLDKTAPTQDKPASPPKKPAAAAEKQVPAQVLAGKQEVTMQIKQVAAKKQQSASQDKQAPVAEKQLPAQEKQATPQKKQADKPASQEKQVTAPADKPVTLQGKQVAAQSSEAAGKEKREASPEKQAKSTPKAAHDKQVTEEIKTLLDQEKVMAALLNYKPKTPTSPTRHSPRLYNEYTRNESIENEILPAPAPSPILGGRLAMREAKIRLMASCFHNRLAGCNKKKKKNGKNKEQATYNGVTTTGILSNVFQNTSPTVDPLDVRDTGIFSVIVQNGPVEDCSRFSPRQASVLGGRVPVIRLNRVDACSCGSVFPSREDLDRHVTSCTTRRKRKRTPSRKRLTRNKGSGHQRKRTRSSWKSTPSVVNFSPERPPTENILESLGLVKKLALQEAVEPGQDTGNRMFLSS